jgi:hypothetical protein
MRLYERVPNIDGWQQIGEVAVNHSPKSTSSSFWRAVHEAIEEDLLDA